jgi:hypothetical protein
MEATADLACSRAMASSISITGASSAIKLIPRPLYQRCPNVACTVTLS